MNALDAGPTRPRAAQLPSLGDAIRVWLRSQTTPVRGLMMSFEAPVVSSLNPWALLLAGLAAIALLGLKIGVTRTLAICAAGSLALHLVLGVV